MKRYFVMVIAIIMIISAAACTSQEKAVQESIKPVKTIELKEQENPAILSYSGIVSSSELKKLAFKSGGRVGRIYVEEGQSIRKGDLLAELDSQDLQYVLAAAKGQMDAAQSVYEKALNGAVPEELENAELSVKKAQAAFDYVMNNYKRMEALYKSNAISASELDKIKLEADVKDAELRQAKELLSQVRNGARSEDRKALYGQLEQAKADYEHKMDMVRDAAMKADNDGYVVDIMYKPGEMVSAGYPVLVVRNEGLVVNVGLAEADLGKVALGTAAKVSVGEKTVNGAVTNISQVPDVQTRTYGIEVTLEENSLNIGAVARVELITGNEKGIWIPITAMLSDGMDYVYITKDNTAEKREITIEAIKGNLVKAKGLKPGEQLVVEGMKRLRAGDSISVLK